VTPHHNTFGLPHIPPRKRPPPQEKKRFDAQLAKVYATHPNASIRALMHATGRSYGYIHRILTNAPEVTLRGRGGSHHRDSRRKKARRVTPADPGPHP
jgi:hypothetical protein